MKKLSLCLSILLIFLLSCSVVFGEDDSYILGKFENGIYTNESLGVKARFGVNWKILSRESIAKLNGVIISASPTLKELTNGAMPSFYAMTEDGTSNVNVTITNLGVMGSAVLSSNIDEFTEAFVKQTGEKITRAYKEMGFSDCRIKRDDFAFAGKKNTGLSIEAEMNNITVYQKQANCIKGEYLYSVTATSMGHNITGKLLDMFSNID